MHWSLLLIVLTALQSSPLVAAPARIALVIGNADYVDGKLKNPVNDAVLVTETLKAQGFQVTTLTNATKRQMKTAIRKFTRSLDKQSVGLFYFAGHGIEFNGNNYLIPVDADIVGEEDVEYESINGGRLLNGLELANNGLNLVILDACRNNPYARSFRSSTRGLSRMQPASGSLIMYATEPGDVAADGRGNNGVFTTHLVDAINQQGEKIEEVFKITAINVSRATGKKQTPYIEGVVLGEFYFSGGAKAASTPAPAISSDESGEHERLFWNSVTADPSKAMFQAYLEQYPDGNYARLAEIKLGQLGITSDTVTKQPVTKQPVAKQPVTKQPVAKQQVAKQQVARLQSPEVEKSVTPATRKSPAEGFDISGTYTSIIESRGNQQQPSVVLTQVGSKITGTVHPDSGFGLEGILNGNSIKIKRYLKSGREWRGVWEISSDGTTLEGKFKRHGHTNLGPEDESGVWNLTRSE